MAYLLVSNKRFVTILDKGTKGEDLSAERRWFQVWKSKANPVGQSARGSKDSPRLWYFRAEFDRLFCHEGNNY